MSGTERTVTRTGKTAARTTSPRADVRLRAALTLTWATLALMTAAAVAGLTVDDVYGGPASTAAMLRGFDLVNLCVAVPALVVSAVLARRGTPRGHLFWVGVLAYVVYTYAYYVFGTGLDNLFLLHVATFACALFGLVVAVAYTGAVVVDVRSGRAARWVSGFLGLLATGLGGMWVFHVLRFMVTGELPAGSGLVESDVVVHLGIALDLAVLVPTYALAAVLLWRGSGWGVVLAAVVLVSGVGHQLSYLVAMPVQTGAGVPGATALDPAEPFIAALFLAATVILLRAAPGGSER